MQLFPAFQRDSVYFFFILTASEVMHNRWIDCLYLLQNIYQQNTSIKENWGHDLSSW